MFAIYKKELRSYFINAIGYVYVGIFLAASALLCCYTTIGSNSYDTSSYFTMLLFSFIVLIPLLLHFVEARIPAPLLESSRILSYIHQLPHFF